MIRIAAFVTLCVKIVADQGHFKFSIIYALMNGMMKLSPMPWHRHSYSLCYGRLCLTPRLRLRSVF